MTKAYHIDSVNRKITEVIINNYTDIYPLLGDGVDIFDAVTVEKHDIIFVDDCGLMRSPEHFFLYSSYGHLLAGNGVVMGSSPDGESIDPKMTIDELKQRVKFMSVDEVAIWVHAHEHHRN